MKYYVAYKYSPSIYHKKPSRRGGVWIIAQSEEDAIVQAKRAAGQAGYYDVQELEVKYVDQKQDCP